MAYRNRLPLVAGLLACLMPGVAAAQVDYIDPMGGFTQVVTTTHEGVKTIFVSGQVGRGDTLREHVESAFAGVVRRLEQAGATPEDVVKVRIFVKDFEPGAVPGGRRGAAGDVPRGALADEHDDRRPGAVRRVVAGRDRGDCGRGRAGSRSRDRAFQPRERLQRGGRGDRARREDGLRGGTGGAAAMVLRIRPRRCGGASAGSSKRAGASFADLVKATTYIVDFDPETDLASYRTGRGQALSLPDMPASTLLGIPAPRGRTVPHMKSTAIAVVGTDGQSVDRAFIDPATGFTQVVTARGSGRPWSRSPARWVSPAPPSTAKPTKCTPTSDGVSRRPARRRRTC